MSKVAAVPSIMWQKRKQYCFPKEAPIPQHTVRGFIFERNSRVNVGPAGVAVDEVTLRVHVQRFTGTDLAAHEKSKRAVACQACRSWVRRTGAYTAGVSKALHGVAGDAPAKREHSTSRQK